MCGYPIFYLLNISAIMSQQQSTVPVPARTKTAYDVLSLAPSDPISRLNGVHSSLDLMLIVLQDSDHVTKNVINDLYNTVYLLAHTLDQVENELEVQLSKIDLPHANR